MPEESKICFSQKIPVGPFQKAVKEQLVTFLQVFRFFSSVFFVFKTNKVQPSISTNLSCAEHPILAHNFLHKHPKQTPLPSSFPRSSLGLRFFSPQAGSRLIRKKRSNLTMTTWRITYFMAGVVFTGFLAWFLLLNRFFWS